MICDMFALYCGFVLTCFNIQNIRQKIFISHVMIIYFEERLVTYLFLGNFFSCQEDKQINFMVWLKSYSPQFHGNIRNTFISWQCLIFQKENIYVNYVYLGTYIQGTLTSMKCNVNVYNDKHVFQTSSFSSRVGFCHLVLRRLLKPRHNIIPNLY